MGINTHFQGKQVTHSICGVRVVQYDVASRGGSIWQFENRYDIDIMPNPSSGHPP